MRPGCVPAAMFLTALLTGCDAPSIVPPPVPLDAFREGDRERVRQFLPEVTAKVTLKPLEFKGKIEAVDFLLSETALMTGILRELRRTRWSLERESGDAFRVTDPEGQVLRIERVLREDSGRRGFLVQGTIGRGLLAPMVIRAVALMEVASREGSMRAETDVYVDVESPAYAKTARDVRSLLEQRLREKLGFVFSSAAWIAEAASQRPEWLSDNLAGSKEVDATAMGEFRKKFMTR